MQVLKAFDETALGYACFIAVCTHTLWSVPGDLGPVVGGINGAYEITSSVALCIVLAVSAALPASYSKRSALTLALVGFCLVMAVQVMFLVPDILSLDSVSVALAGVFSGIGNGLLFGCWVWLLSSRAPALYWKEIVVGSLVSALLEIVMSAASGGALLLALIACAGVSVVLFVNVASAIGVADSGVEPSDFNAIRLFAENFRVIICIAVLAFAFGVVRTIVAQSGIPINVADIASVGMFIAAGVLLGFIQKKNAYPDLTWFYQILFPVIALGFIAIPFLGSLYGSVLFVVLSVAFFLASMTMTSLSCDISRKTGASAVRVFGAIACVVYAFLAVGYQLKRLFGGSEFGFAELVFLVLVSFYALSIVLVALNMTKRKSTENALERSESKDSIEALAGLYKLTNREAEVLEYVVEGRDVPFMAEVMVLSPNTVRTHVKSLYRKVGVHSRQELISVIQEKRNH